MTNRSVAGELMERIRQELSTGSLAKSEVLPASRAWARFLNVAPATLLKALRHLVRQGALERRPGSRRFHRAQDGVFPLPPGGPQAQASGSAAPAYRVEQVTETLKREILSGEYPLGTALPSALELRSRLRCGSRTLASALENLVERELLRRRGRGFEVRTGSSPVRRGSSVFIAGTRKTLANQPHFNLPFIRGIEDALHGLDWGGLRCFVAEDPWQAQAIETLRVGGIIHPTYGRHTEWIAWLDAMKNVPLVIVDMAEQMRWRPEKRGRYRIIRPDNQGAGREMGRFLTDLGHRRAVVFSPLGHGAQSRWPDKRLRGLEDVFEGVGGGLEQFRPDFGPATAAADWRQSQAHLEALHRQIQAAGRLPENAIDPSFRAVHDTFAGDRLAAALEPAFHQALRDSRNTAWIGLNDDVAAIAQVFLLGQGIAVPGQVSLVGFDNAPVSYALGITSYDFRYDAMGHLAVRSLAMPHEVGADRKGVVVVPGRLVPRESAA